LRAYSYCRGGHHFPRERSTVDIEAEPREDLALDDADAESVIGGSKKKAHRAGKPGAKTAGHSLPPIIIQSPPTPPADGSDPGVSSVDPSADTTDTEDC
jgi:hypothetical protein